MASERIDGYLPISAYAMIGDGRTAALVGDDGSVDWCCLPNFDSPAVLGRLLDAEIGGYFRVAPRAAGVVSRRYRSGSNVLETRTEVASGSLCVRDAMVRGQGRILRLLSVEQGEVEVEIELRPGFDFGRSHASVELRGRRLVARSGSAWFECAAPGPWQASSSGAWVCRFQLGEGQRALAELAWQAAAHSSIDSAVRELAESTRWWRAWAGQIAYRGPHRASVVRSALLLRALVFEPRGTLVAAPTTSLPECLGGPRNWDYRYTWLRDACLILDAFMRLGMHDEAMSFWDWIEGSEIGEGAPPRVVYRVGERGSLAERELSGLEGYRGSRPVRVGNAAVDQDQHDVYGYVIDAAHACQTKMRAPHPQLRPVLRSLADAAARRWRKPDQGLWEMRTEPQHFVHSKLMCWLALDRAVDLARREWLDGDAERWASERDAIRAELLAHGWNPRLRAFTQAYASEVPDAAALELGNLGLLSPSDPRFLDTIEYVRRELECDGLVHRYRTEDGLSGDEGAFVICSFWLAEALARAGRIDQAHAVFEQTCRRANDVGLFAEQIDPKDGVFLGNMPQAFSHLALIRAALALEACERGAASDQAASTQP